MTSPDEPPLATRARPPGGDRHPKSHLLFGGLAASVIAIHFLWSRPVPPVAAFGLVRSAVLGGEIWRFWTAPLLHGDGRHLFLDLLDLLVVWVAFARRLSPGAWLVVWLSSCLGSGLGTLLLRPTAWASVGLSGPLHGLFVAGAVDETRNGIRWLGLLFVVLVAGKLSIEQWSGSLSAAALTRSADVDAHLGGALFGLAAWLLLALARRVRSSGSSEAKSAIQSGSE